MLQFLPMLLKGISGASGGAAGGAAGGAGGGLAEQFMGALGASGSPNQSNKQIGMQFANAGLHAPQIPNVPLMQNMNQQTMQRQAPQTFNPLIQMLMNGGR